MRSLMVAAATAFASACSSGGQSEANAAKTSADASPGPALGSDPIKREFGNTDVLAGWLLACDNRRVCRAQPKRSGGSLMIRREPGPNGLIRVVLDGQDPWEGPSTPDLASLRLTGPSAMPDAPWRVDRDAESAVLEGTAALRFVRALIGAQMLSYRMVGDSPDSEPFEVPLNGAREALAAMDEAQGHAGGEAAFVSVGPRPRAALPAAPALPVIEVVRPASAALPPGFAARVRRDNPRLFADCDDAPRVEDEAYPLNAADALVIAPCSHGMRDSYYLLLRVPRDALRRAERVILPTIAEMDDAYEDGSGTYVNLEWDPEAGQLYSMYRSCAGGCGDNVTWVFDGEAFRLVSYAFYEAGGAEVLDLYRAEVRRRQAARDAQ